MLRWIGVVVGGLALSLGGGVVWSLLFRTNLQWLPELPWSAVVMSIVIGLSYRALSRIPFLPRLAPPSAEGPWLPWVAAMAAAACLISAVVVGLRLARLPADAFASSVDMQALSTPMQGVRVVMGSSVAAFFEELGFRGVIQASLIRRHGAVRAIGLTTVVFYLAHLGHGWTHGDVTTILAVAVPILLGSVLFGALAAVTGSLGPSLVTHALADMVLLSMEWTGKHRLDPMGLTEIDAHFVWWTAAALAASVASVVLLGRLASRAHPSIDPAQPPSQHNS